MPSIRRLVLFVTFLAAHVASHADCSVDFTQRLNKRFPSAAGAHVEKAFQGFCSVAKDGEVIFVSDDATVLITGDVVDLNDKHSITAAIKAANVPKINIGELPLSDAIKIGSGSRKLYVFSDPDCPYCRQLQAQLQSVQDTQVFIFPIPLVTLHAKSRVVAESIWCQGDKQRAKSWLDYLATGVAPSQQTCDNPISRNLALAEKLHVYGTPAIVFPDGTIAPGLMPAEAINQKLYAAAVK